MQPSNKAARHDNAILAATGLFQEYAPEEDQSLRYTDIEPASPKSPTGYMKLLHYTFPIGAARRVRAVQQAQHMHQ
jgi:hypothetical protein